MKVDIGPGCCDFLSAECERLVRDFIETRTGIIIHEHQRAKLRETLLQTRLALGCANCRDLLRALNGAEQLPALELLISGITVGESYFFRDPEQFTALHDAWLPEIIDRKRRVGKLEIRAWSAGCAMGQELGSLGILLDELLPDADQWSFHLLGTDLNNESLAKAIAGDYRDWALRGLSEERRVTYFTRHDNCYHLIPRVHARLKYAYLNLVEDVYPSIINETYALDLILCRNVFIYMDQNTARAIVRRFADCLAPEGLLLLGAADLGNWEIAGLTAKSAGLSNAYSRPVEAGELSSGSACELAVQRRHIRDVFIDIAPENDLFPSQSTPADVRGPDITDIKDALSSERWGAALETIERALAQGNACEELLYQRAYALANLGRLEDALAACIEVVGLDATDKRIYLVQSLVLEELGRAVAAESSLRKALYLDSQCVEAYYLLGMLLLRGGRREAGANSLRSALHFAMQGSADRKVEHAPGLTYAQLVELLRNELVVHEQPASIGRGVRL